MGSALSKMIGWAAAMALATVALATWPGMTRTVSDGIHKTKPTRTEPIPVLTNEPIPSQEPLPVLTDHPGGGGPAADPISWSHVGLGALVVLGVALAGFTLWRIGRARSRAAAKRRDQVQRWTQGVKALNAASEALIAFEMDFENKPEAAYFDRPLLADVNEPTSARFYAAYGEAQALRTDTVPTDDQHIADFVKAAQEALHAFGIADENARRKARIGVVNDDKHLSMGEKRKLDQARKLLAQAIDPAASSSEASAAHAKALELLDSIGVVIPEKLATKGIRAIEQRRQLALTT